MENKKYDFKIGDEVITVNGEIGEIIDICTCSECERRGFYELTWKGVGENTHGVHWITEFDMLDNFRCFYKIGNYRFNDFDKESMMNTIKYYESILKESKRCLQTIEELENKMEE
mgnify:CR=1 FL=1